MIGKFNFTQLLFLMQLLVLCPSNVYSQEQQTISIIGNVFAKNGENEKVEQVATEIVKIKRNEHGHENNRERKTTDGKLLEQEQSIYGANRIIKANFTGYVRKDSYEITRTESGDFIGIYSDADKKKEVEIRKGSKPLYLTTELSQVPKDYWQELQKGEQIEFEMAIPFLNDKFSFTMSKVSSTSGSDETVRVKFSMSSFFLRMIADDIYMDFNNNTKDLLQFIGYVELFEEMKERYDYKHATVVYERSDRK